jgi:LuxR family maltose regulon positive regulatory protein
LVARLREEFGRAEALLDALEVTGAAERRAVGIWVATERALLALANHGAAAAAAVLGGRRASPHPSMPDGVLARRRAAEANVLVAAGQLEAAQVALDDAFGGESLETMAARARVALARGDASAARALLDDWPQEQQPRAGRALRLWASVLDHLDGHAEQAMSAMAEVAAEAESEGDIELFALAGSLAMGPIRALYRAAPSPFLRSLVERQTTVSQAKPVKGLPEQLTDREYMVLTYLPTRQSNAEIAERLGVSLNTVKTHLKHVYRKLDVVGRSDAVDAAERMHLF